MNVDDLIAVITGWGPCPPSGVCPGDLVPTGGCGDDTVNVDDLTLVINGWGNCPGCGPVGSIPGPPQDIWDCEEIAEQHCTPEEYGDCWARCLCGLGYEEACE